MTYLILGLILWSASHMMKRITPGLRSAMGDGPGKLAVTLASVAGIVLMVVGFRAAPVITIWSPPQWLVGVNNLFMLIAIYLMAGAGMKTAVARRMRHPMLASVRAWAGAHLLVNGDLASIVLFGGLLAWATAAPMLINRAEPQWTPPEPQGRSKEIVAAVAAIVVYGAIGAVHNYLGYWPFS